MPDSSPQKRYFIGGREVTKDEYLAAMMNPKTHFPQWAEAQERIRSLEEQLEAAHKFVRDVLDFCNDTRPATVHDFDAIRAAAENLLGSNPASEPS